MFMGSCVGVISVWVIRLVSISSLLLVIVVVGRWMCMLCVYVRCIMCGISRLIKVIELVMVIVIVVYSEVII